MISFADLNESLTINKYIKRILKYWCIFQGLQNTTILSLNYLFIALGRTQSCGLLYIFTSFNLNNVGLWYLHNRVIKYYHVNIWSGHQVFNGKARGSILYQWNYALSFLNALFVKYKKRSNCYLLNWVTLLFRLRLVNDHL